jgi:hypothetical protein
MARARDAAIILILACVLLPLAAATIVVPRAPAAAAAAAPEDPRCRATPPRRGALAVYPSDMEQLQFLLNAKFVEAEWFLHAALGRGVDYLDRNLSAGGPRPAGARKAALDFRTTEVAAELGYQEVGHIRYVPDDRPSPSPLGQERRIQRELATLAMACFLQGDQAGRGRVPAPGHRPRRRPLRHDHGRRHGRPPRPALRPLQQLRQLPPRVLRLPAHHGRGHHEHQLLPHGLPLQTGEETFPPQSQWLD